MENTFKILKKKVWFVSLIQRFLMPKNQFENLKLPASSSLG